MSLRYSFNVKYKGSCHCGWQYGRTVKMRGVVNNLNKSVKRSTNGLPVFVMGSGRTDSGVHATNQRAQVEIIRQKRVPAHRLVGVDQPALHRHATKEDRPYELMESICTIREATEQFTRAQTQSPRHINNSFRTTSNYPKLHPTPPKSQDISHNNNPHDSEINTLINSIAINYKTFFNDEVNTFNPNFNHFIRSTALLSCVKDEYAHLYQNESNINHIILNSTDPSKPLKFSKNVPSPQNLQKTYNTPVFESIYGANILQLQPPVNPEKIQILTNQSLLGDTPHPTKIKNVPNNGNLPNLDELSDDDSPMFLSMKQTSNTDQIPSPPIVFGSISVNDTRVEVPLYAPSLISKMHDSPPSNLKNSQQSKHDIDIFSLLPSHNSPRHVRFDAYKRSYRFRIHFTPSFDPFDCTHRIEASPKSRSHQSHRVPKNKNQTFLQHEIENISTLPSLNPPTYHNPSTTWQLSPTPMTSSLQHFDIHRAFQAAQALTGKHNYNAFRNTQCQADSPIRRVDNISISFEPSFSDLVSNGISTYAHNHEQHIDFAKKVNYLCTAGLEQFKTHGYSVSFAASCRAIISDIISCLITDHNVVASHHPVMQLFRVYQRIDPNDPNNTTNIRSDYMLNPGTHYEELLQDEKSIVSILQHTPNHILSENTKTLLIDLFTSTQHLHQTTLNDFRGLLDDKKRELVVSHFLKHNCSKRNSVLVLEYTAGAYLHNQVRIMTGAIVDAGFAHHHRPNHKPPHFLIEELLLSGESRASNPFKTAPPDGLYLSNVYYPSSPVDLMNSGALHFDEPVSSLYGSEFNLSIWRRLRTVQSKLSLTKPLVM